MDTTAPVAKPKPRPRPQVMKLTEDRKSVV